MCDINGGFVDLYDSDDDSIASFATAACSEESKGIKCSELLPHEVSSLEEKLQRIVVIQQTDQSYHMGINDIRDQAIISVLVEPSFYGRHCNKNVIIIATSNNTYVFDLKALGGIFPELSRLLNAEYPKKIMHYSHRVCDQLYHQHKLNVNGICDTFVALCVARQDRSIISLREAISHMFNIPITELTCQEIDDITESKRNFTARPLSRGQLQYLAKIAILQQKLHDRLIYGNICIGLQEMSSKFSYQFNKNKNSDQVALNMNTGSSSGFECINPYYEISSTSIKSKIKNCTMPPKFSRVKALVQKDPEVWGVTMEALGKYPDLGENLKTDGNLLSDGDPILMGSDKVGHSINIVAPGASITMEDECSALVQVEEGNLNESIDDDGQEDEYSGRDFIQPRAADRESSTEFNYKPDHVRQMLCILIEMINQQQQESHFRFKGDPLNLTIESCVISKGDVGSSKNFNPSPRVLPTEQTKGTSCSESDPIKIRRSQLFAKGYKLKNGIKLGAASYDISPENPDFDISNFVKVYELNGFLSPSDLNLTKAILQLLKKWHRLTSIYDFCPLSAKNQKH